MFVSDVSNSNVKSHKTQSNTCIYFISPYSQLGFPKWLSGKEPPAIQETQVQSLGWEDILEEGMATYSHFLPGESHGQTEKPGRLQSTGSRRVRHDGSDIAFRHECMDTQLAHQYISTKFDNLDLTERTYSFPTLCYMTFFARHTSSALVTEFKSGGCERNGFYSSDILEAALGWGCSSPKAG